MPDPDFRPSSTKPHAADQPRSRLRALIVSDSSEDESAIRQLLGDGGRQIEVERVETAKNLWEALASRPWDLVISDFSTPGLNSMAVLHVVRHIAPALPMLVLAADAPDEFVSSVRQAGAKGVVVKSQLDRLPAAVREVLKSAAMQPVAIDRESSSGDNGFRLHSILGALEDIIWSIELPTLRLAYLNQASEKIYGRPAGTFLGGLDAWLAAVHPEDRERMRRYTQEVLRAGTGTTEFRILRPDGDVRWIHDRAQVVSNERGRKMRIDGIARDITEHKRSQAMLYRAAHYDALTGLPNRALLSDRLTQAITHAERRQHMVAVMFVDIDRFKTVNDSLGHEAGDELLRQVAVRVTQTLRGEDTVARLGGDEFVVILPEIAGEEDAAAVAAKLAQAIEPPMQIGGVPVYCTASIGIAVFPRDGHDVGTLLRHADAAMYGVKRNGRNGISFHDAQTCTVAIDQFELEKDLRTAVANNELELHFQPQVDLGNEGAICGLEALLRWRHPTRGLLSPQEFIPLAEESGLIIPIGEWVLHEACRRCKEWTDRFDPNLRVAVNLSVRQFNGDGVIRAIASALASSSLPAKNLKIEITESLLMQDMAHSLKLLRQMKTMGVSIAMDDFGTGYSSLAYLRRFPVDEIKIDKSFVRDISNDPDDAAICVSIMAMAKALRLHVVAEGVENEAQLGFLQQRQCEAIQGYVFSRPLPSEEVTALLQSGRRLPVAAAAPSAPPRRLLLVDDEENILSSLRRLFRRDGYEIFATTDPNEAFSILAERAIGVIISDQRMPTMSGTEFLRRVKDLYPDTIRIVLSGYTELQSITSAINEGAIYRFLTKPWEDESLRKAIREAFQQQELLWQNARLDEQARESSIQLAEANRQLEQLLSDKSRRIARDAHFLGIAQEALHYVPVPVLGFDHDGMIVTVNAAARSLLPGLAPGLTVLEGLPPSLAECIADELAPLPRRVEIDGAHWQPNRQRMGTHSGSSGWLLTFMPDCPDAQDTGQALAALRGVGEPDADQAAA